MAIDTTGPDAALWVEFYSGVQENTYKSEQQGHRVNEDVIMIRIRIPGDSTLEIDRAMEEPDKRRFPLQWAIFQNQAQEGTQAGTPIADLPGMTKATVENLKVAKFYTIEQVAVASDQALQSLRMQVGLDPMAFRERCRRYLANAKEGASQSQLEQELAARDAKLAAMEGMMKQMQETLAAQQEMIALQAELNQGEEKAT